MGSMTWAHVSSFGVEGGSAGGGRKCSYGKMAPKPPGIQLMWSLSPEECNTREAGLASPQFTLILVQKHEIQSLPKR